jgi:hypothetical protein
VSLRSLRSSACAALWFGAALVVRAAGAHDFWIEPSSFTPEPAAAVALHLRVGQQWLGDPLPRDGKRVERFVLAGPEGVAEVPGVEGVDPAGVTRVGGNGLYVVSYASFNTPLSLAPEKFEEYLRLEGLEWAIAERARRGESAADSREVYARCAKAVLHVGSGGPSVGFDRTFGCAFEIVPEQDPSGVPVGAALTVRVLYRGKPFAGALVVALPKTHPQAFSSARSDRAGRATLQLAERGAWLVKAVHLERLAETEAVREQADWQSVWASLTFALP